VFIWLRPWFSHAELRSFAIGTFRASEGTPHRLVKIDADMSRRASTERDDRGKAQSGRRKAILAGARLRRRNVRERAIYPFSRVRTPGANRRQDAFGRRCE
jgi:hypothetical protein